jgi:hypothetical protein
LAVTDSPAADPAAVQRDIVRTRVEPEIRRLYEDAPDSIGLSGNEHESLIRILLEQHAAVALRRVGAEPEHASKRGATRARIESQFGAQRASRFDAYERTIDVRRDVETLRTTLESAGLPMTEASRRQLLDEALSADRGRVHLELTGRESLPELNRKLLADRKERDQRLLPVVRSLLTKPQADHYEAFATRRREQLEAFATQPPRQPATR